MVRDKKVPDLPSLQGPQYSMRSCGLNLSGLPLLAASSFSSQMVPYVRLSLPQTILSTRQAQSHSGGSSWYGEEEEREKKNEVFKTWAPDLLQYNAPPRRSFSCTSGCLRTPRTALRPVRTPGRRRAPPHSGRTPGSTRTGPPSLLPK